MNDATKETFGPEVRELSDGMEINDGDNRWWIQSKGQGGNRPTLVRIASSHDRGDGVDTTEMFEITLQDTTNEPLTVVRYKDVPTNINLSTPITDKEPETLLQQRQLENKSGLEALYFGPIKSLQEWSSPTLEIDDELASQGHVNFRNNLSKLTPSRFEQS